MLTPASLQIPTNGCINNESLSTTITSARLLIYFLTCLTTTVISFYYCISESRQTPFPAILYLLHPRKCMGGARILLYSKRKIKENGKNSNTPRKWRSITHCKSTSILLANTLKNSRGVITATIKATIHTILQLLSDGVKYCTTWKMNQDSTEWS